MDMDDMGTSYISSSNRNNNHRSSGSSSGSHTTRKKNHTVQHSNKTIQTLPEKRDQSTFTYESNSTNSNSNNNNNNSNSTTANDNNESLMDRRHNNPIYPMQSFLDRKGKYSF